MQPEQIRKLVEDIVAGAKAGDVGADAIGLKRDAERAAIELVTMFITDVHKIAQSMGEVVIEITPGDYPG